MEDRLLLCIQNLFQDLDDVYESLESNKMELINQECFVTIKVNKKNKGECTNE